MAIELESGPVIDELPANLVVAWAVNEKVASSISDVCCIAGLMFAL